MNPEGMPARPRSAETSRREVRDADVFVIMAKTLTERFRNSEDKAMRSRLVRALEEAEKMNPGSLQAMYAELVEPEESLRAKLWEEKRRTEMDEVRAKRARQLRGFLPPPTKPLPDVLKPDPRLFPGQ